MVKLPVSASFDGAYWSIENFAGWDDAVAAGDIADAVEDASTIANSMGLPLFIPDAAPTSGTWAGYNLPFSRTITLAENSSIIMTMQSPAIYTGSANEPLMVIGDEEEVSGDQYIRVWLKRNTQSAGTNEAIVGLRTINMQRCREAVVSIERCTIGWQLLGSGEGHAYNYSFRPGLMRDNRYHYDLQVKRRASDFQQGWVNENHFLGGYCNTSTGYYEAVGSPTTWGPVGVRMSRYDSNATYAIDNNKFERPTFELTGFDSWTVGPYCWQIDAAAAQNKIEDARAENAGSNFLRINATSGVADNLFTIQYTDQNTVSETSFVDDQGLNNNNRVYTQKLNMYQQPMTCPTSSTEEFCRRVTLYKKTGEISIPGWGWFTHGVSGLSLGSIAKDIDVASGYLKILSGAVEGPGRKFRTTHCKEVCVMPLFESGYSGRVIVQCLDASNNVLGGTYSGRVGSVTGKPYLFGAAMSWVGSYWGGVFMSDANYQRLVFGLHDDVKQIIVANVQWGSEVRLRGCLIYGTNGFLPDITPLPIDFHKRLAYEWPQNRNATATCSLTGDGISTTFTITQAGGCYAVAPTISFSGGGGTGAAATATVNSLASGGSVTTITRTAAGSGYTTAPTMTLTESTDKTAIYKGDLVHNANFAGNIADTAAWIYTTTGQYDSVDSTAL